MERSEQEFFDPSSLAPYKRNSRPRHKKKSRNKSRIFVGGIPPDTNYDELVAYFRQFGAVLKVELPKNRRNGSYKGFSFVTFQDPSALERAIQQPHHYIRDNKMVVTRAVAASRASQMTKQTQNQKIFVKGLPSKVTQQELQCFFSTFGEVVSVIIPMKKFSERNRGIAYVVMKDIAIFEMLIEWGSLDFKGKRLEIMRAASPSSIIITKKRNNQRGGGGHDIPPPGPQVGYGFMEGPRHQVGEPINLEMNPHEHSSPQYHVNWLQEQSNFGGRIITQVNNNPTLQIEQENYIWGNINSHQSQQESSSDPEESWEDQENYVFNLAMTPDEPVLIDNRFPENFESMVQNNRGQGTEQGYQYEQTPPDLSGGLLYSRHSLVFRVRPLPRKEIGEVSSRNNNGRLVQTSNHSHYDYLCNMEGGRFEEGLPNPSEQEGPREREIGILPREHHFGPTNHFGSNNRAQGVNEQAINEEGITRFGPNFTRPVQEFFIDQQDAGDDEEPTIEVKQTVCTKYAISNEGLIFTGSVNEVNVWGTHPHDDQLRRIRNQEGFEMEE